MVLFMVLSPNAQRSKLVASNGSKLGDWWLPDLLVGTFGTCEVLNQQERGTETSNKIENINPAEKWKTCISIFGILFQLSYAPLNTGRMSMPYIPYSQDDMTTLALSLVLRSFPSIGRTAVLFKCLGSGLLAHGIKKSRSDSMASHWFGGWRGHFADCAQQVLAAGRNPHRPGEVSLS